MLISYKDYLKELAALFEPRFNESYLNGMKKCVNVPRFLVENWDFPLDIERWAWISIQEGDEKDLKGNLIQYPHTKNETLDQLPSLKLKFHDLQNPIDHNGIMLWPPSEKDASEIVKFVLNNQNKGFIVNCAMGVSRSGAICQFLESLGWEWPKENKQLAQPNKFLVELLEVEYKNYK